MTYRGWTDQEQLNASTLALKQTIEFCDDVTNTPQYAPCPWAPAGLQGRTWQAHTDASKLAGRCDMQ